MKRIKTGDTVVVIAGKDKGKSGTVKKVLTEANKVIVEGIGLVSKHVKPNPNINQQGGILKIESAIHVSNVAMLNPATKKADKVGFKLIEGKKVRYFKSDNEIIDRS